MRREEKPTKCHCMHFIARIICSVYFGHFYAHHQELETMYVLLPPVVCSAWLLVVGGQVQGSRLCVRYEGCCTTRSFQSCNIPHPERIACLPSPDLRQPATKALHIIGGNNTQSRAPVDGHKSARNMLSVL